MRIILMLLGVMVIAISCSKQSKINLFDEQVAMGTVDKKLNEASGLVASIANPGYLWTHNDSGNPSEIFLLNEKAEIKKTFWLSTVVNRDWEDITLGPGPVDGVNYLYIADIGDNEARYDSKILYRIAEPGVTDSITRITHVDTLIVNLPDGARDSEAIMVDPNSKNLYIISKREHAVRVYEITFPFNTDTLQAVQVSTLPFNNVVAANISSTGDEILIKTYREILYWKRDKDETIADVFKRDPKKISYHIEPQGEAIAWKADGSGFYTLSESETTGGTLFYFKRK